MHDNYKINSLNFPVKLKHQPINPRQYGASALHPPFPPPPFSRAKTFFSTQNGKTQNFNLWITYKTLVYSLNRHWTRHPLLCQYRLFMYACASKNAMLSKDVVFFLVWYNMIRWSSHIYRKSSFLSSHSLLFLVKKHRGGHKIKMKKSDTGQWGEKCHYASYIPFEWPHV